MNDELKLLFNILLSKEPSRLIKENEEYIFSIIPELKNTKGFNQNNLWHIYDVYEHILHVIDGVPRDLTLRLVALFHDIGKPFTYTIDENNVGHFYNHWGKSCEIFLNFSLKYNLPSELTILVHKLIYYHDISLSKLNEIEYNKFLNEFSIDEINMLFTVKKSDLLAQAPEFHFLLKEYDKQMNDAINKLTRKK